MAEASSSGKHTAGAKSARWTWEEHQLSEGFSCIVYDEHGRRISDHQSRERAALIAAAPEMAADLRSAWAVLSIIIDNGWVPAEHLAPVEQCRDNAARTLSTALGEDR